MKKEVKPGAFIKKPKYIGGKATWQKLLKENLKYPAKALEKKIEGKVNISYEVNGNGKVLRPKVTKGIGYGCDEEAIRLVKMMKYEKVNNRKVKIITHHKIAIQFKLPKPKKHFQKFKYTVTTLPKSKAKKVSNNNQKIELKNLPKKVTKSYTYTIKF